MKKYLVVGSGIVGCVVAHELAKANNHVTIVERRNHIGGNLFDYMDEHGIRVHKYGPHIFHTNKKTIYEYINKFCELKKYELICGAVIDGKCVPTAFNFKAIDVFFPEESGVIKEHIKLCFPKQESVSVLELLRCDDNYVQKFARFLYEKDYKLYTAKQWGIAPEKVDVSIFNRVPIVLSDKDRYFSDEYQAMPVRGYMELIENLLRLERIEVILNTDALDKISFSENKCFYDGILYDKIIYTGPLDELFGCKYGRLPYRSLRFDWKHENIDSFQELPVVAYPQADGFTRITEYKKLPVQNVKGTTYAVEYPVPYDSAGKVEPYYPVLTTESQSLYIKYRTLADNVSNLLCCGRLADFKYYNIDQAVERGLKVSEEILR